MPRTGFLFLILFVLALTITGCEEPVGSTQNTVDPLFQEFYESLGGKSILGPVISIMYEENGKKLQFTKAALMMFDAQAPESGHYRLAPLGNALNVATPPLAATSPNGHEIYPGFLPLFRQIGGTRITGHPITSVKADPEHKRIIQYFENVGFYQLESDPPDKAHLLDYGVWKCAQACKFKSPQESIVKPLSTPGFGIAEAVDRLDPGLTGFPLTDIYISKDGREEQIFENVIIYTDSASPGGIALRPLPHILEIRSDTPSSAGHGEGKFIAVNSNQGYYVPYHIDEYIERNNGYGFIGFPINNYNQINDGLYRQCFENLCLDYRPDEIDGLEFRPMALGRRYKQQYTNIESENKEINAFDSVTLTVWERYPVITSAEGQEIYTIVLDNGKPLKNIDLVLKLTLPDGIHQTENFPPTGQDGQSRLEIGPIVASNGTLIIYQVCLTNIPEELDCILDDYLIWGNP